MQISGRPRPVALSDVRVRTGVDLASVRDVEESVARFGSRYLTRIYTSHERASCGGTPSAVAAGLAARFAAKEAAMKVLRPRDTAVDWRSIEVRRDDVGACSLHLDGAAAELAAEAGIVDISVALSHEADLAAAVVVALCEDGDTKVGEH